MLKFLILFPILAISAVAFASGDLATELVDVKARDFSILMDIRYATPKNFTGRTLYPEAKCFLRKPVADALSRVQAALAIEGYGIKVFDCYRPLSVQKKMWEQVHDERYVADPAKGPRHCRGAAVDVTLVERTGEPVEMPSDYDDFSPKSSRAYQGASRTAIQDRARLEAAMKREGFVPFPSEWWHFDYKNWELYPVLDIPFAQLK